MVDCRSFQHLGGIRDFPNSFSICGLKICMYNPNRLEWHQGNEYRIKLQPFRFLWWVLSSSKRGFCRYSIALLSLTPRAKTHQRYLRGFSFGIDRVTHDTLQGLHGLPSQNTPHSYTPESKRRTALIRRLLKQLVHGGNKASCISELIRQAHLVLFGFSMLIGVNE